MKYIMSLFLVVFCLRSYAQSPGTNTITTDALGRKIATFDEGKNPKGEYNFVFNKPNLAAASYYVRVYADNYKSPTIGIVKTN